VTVRPLTLADFSAVERDVRASHYPRMVAAGDFTADEAQHDWQCWVAIAALFADPDAKPAFHSWGLSWDDLEKAANKALAARDAACAAKPGSAPLEARRDAVAAIAWRLANKAQFYRTINRQLQERRAA